MPEKDSFYFLDTVVLSNFAFANRLDLLVSRYKNRLVITSEVCDEISKGISCGFTELTRVSHLIEDDICKAHTLSKVERRLYITLLKNLGSGEASSIASAITVQGTVATDDRAARNICQERGLKYTGTIGILKKQCQLKILSAREADNILDKISKHGIHSLTKKEKEIMDKRSRRNSD